MRKYPEHIDIDSILKKFRYSHGSRKKQSGIVAKYIYEKIDDLEESKKAQMSVKELKAREKLEANNFIIEYLDFERLS